MTAVVSLAANQALPVNVEASAAYGECFADFWRRGNRLHAQELRLALDLARQPGERGSAYLLVRQVETEIRENSRRLGNLLARGIFPGDIIDIPGGGGPAGAIADITPDIVELRFMARSIKDSILCNLWAERSKPFVSEELGALMSGLAKFLARPPRVGAIIALISIGGAAGVFV